MVKCVGPVDGGNVSTPATDRGFPEEHHPHQPRFLVVSVGDTFGELYPAVIYDNWRAG